MRRAAALLALGLLAAGCGSGAATQKPAVDGRTLFVQQCGACHTLADAGTRGTVGADRERNKPTKATVLRYIDDGKGTMPAHILGGREADLVAAYVARAVRKKP